MEFLRSPRNWVSGLGVAVLALAVPHFVDDFLYGMPAEFGLTNPQAQILGGLFFGASAGVLVLAARGRRAGYFGTLVLGALLSAAAALKHFPLMAALGPYWGGALSEGAILGLFVSGVALAGASVAALRSR